MAVKQKSAAKKSQVKLGDAMIPASRLHLDLENPRHEPVESEAEAIARLCDSEMIAELVQDIAQRGSLSPLEVFGVIPMEGHPGHFVSLEGNRRTCALIVATDPSRAPESIRRQLQRSTANASVPKQIKAHVFAKREDAKQWIDLRHLGLQGGAGIKEWNPAQKARASTGNTKTSARDNTLSVLVLDRLVARGMLIRADPFPVFNTPAPPGDYPSFDGLRARQRHGLATLWAKLLIGHGRHHAHS